MNDFMNKSYTIVKIQCISFAIFGVMVMGFTISHTSEFAFSQTYEEISEACGDPDTIDTNDPTAMSQISEMLECGIEFSKNYNEGTPSSERSNPNAITSTIDEDGNSWTEYTNSDLGISFEYPASWGLQEKENRFDTSAEAVVYDRDGAGYNMFKLISRDDAMEQTIDSLGFDFAVNILEDAFSKDYRIVEGADFDRYAIDGKETATFLYVAEVEELYETPTQVFIVNDDGNLVTFGYQDTKANFDTPESQERMEHIINSIEFLR